MNLLNVGDRVRHLKRGSTYRIIGVTFAALSEFKDGAEAFYWQWFDYNHDFHDRIAVERPDVGDDELLKVKLPVSIQRSTDKPYGNALIYQCETDHKVYARYQSEFTSDRFERLEDDNEN